MNMAEINVKFRLSIGYKDAIQEDIVKFVFADNANTEEINTEIEGYYVEWITGLIDGGWKIVEGEEV